MDYKIKNMVEFIKSLNDNQIEFMLEESATVDTLDKELIYLTCEMVKHTRTNDNKCVICHGDISEGSDASILTYGCIYGHNAEPVANGKCCSTCNQEKVLPARLEQIKNYTSGKNNYKHLC